MCNHDLKILLGATRYARYLMMVNSLKIPPRYQQATLADFDEVLTESLVGESVYIYGKPGVGKTHLMASLAVNQALTDSNNPIDPEVSYARFIGTQNLLALIKAEFNKSQRNDEEVFEEFSKAKWLYLDDFGTELPSDWATSTLYRIIDYRWNFKLPIVVTSNNPIDGIAGGFSERIASRLMGMCTTITLEGKDRRVRK